MRTIIFILFLTLTAGAAAQTMPIPHAPFPPAVKSYVGLTDEQTVRILRLNSELAQFMTSKLRRQIQVRAEIGQETRKEALDATALGLRYLELEVIRRELADERKKTVRAVHALLNEPQKVKVAALEQALRDRSTACAAVALQLLEEPEAPPASRVALPQWIETDQFSQTSGVMLGAAGACPQVPVGVILSGDFSAQQ